MNSYRKIISQGKPHAYPIVLTIAGSDSCAGAGLQNDLKTFHALQTYGMSVVTSITAQTHKEVRSAFMVPEDYVKSQIHAILETYPVSVVKIGMLGQAQLVRTVFNTLAEYSGLRLVLDPVMVATSGATLLEEEAINVLKEYFPNVFLLTPNLMESSLLLDFPMARHTDEKLCQAKALLTLGPEFVLIKGGHDQESSCTDILMSRYSEPVVLKHPKIGHGSMHGTGCMLSSACAALLAKGKSIEDATRLAIAYVVQHLKRAEHANGCAAGSSCNPLMYHEPLEQNLSNGSPDHVIKCS